MRCSQIITIFSALFVASACSGFNWPEETAADKKITVSRMVTNLVAVAGNGTVQLTWTSPSYSDYLGVRIMRKTGSYSTNETDGTGVYAAPGTTFTDTGLTNGTLYYYSAYAYNTTSTVFELPAQISETPVAPTANITALVAKPWSTRAILSWTNPGCCFTAVKIVRKLGGAPANNTDGTEVYNSNGTSFVDTGLTNGTAYFYALYAHNAGANYSTGIQTTLTPKPVIVVATGAGVSFSTDGGATYTNTTSGLPATAVSKVFMSNAVIYAATTSGLGISTDFGNSFIARTTADGLGSNSANDVAVVGSTVYVATAAEISISTDGGTSFTGHKTTADGLGHNQTLGLRAVGSNVYACTDNGLSTSTNSGTSFTNRSTGDGIGNTRTRNSIVDGSNVYVATDGGLSIANDGGVVFANKTTGNGLGWNIVWDVYATGSTVYAATDGGFSISTDGGNSFINKTSVQGLPNNSVRGLFVYGSKIYVATANTGGVAESSDGGLTFTNVRTTANGLGDNYSTGIFVE